MGAHFSPMVFVTWGGLHAAGKVVVKAVFALCTSSLLSGARPAAVGTRAGIGQPDDLWPNPDRWEPGIKPVPWYSFVGQRIRRPKVSAVLHYPTT